MIDTVQAILLFVIVLLTILLIVLGVQVFFILRDFRRTISKANRVLDNTEAITESVSQPINFLTSIFAGTQSLSAITSIVKLILGGSKKDNKKNE